MEVSYTQVLNTVNLCQVQTNAVPHQMSEVILFLLEISITSVEDHCQEFQNQLLGRESPKVFAKPTWVFNNSGQEFFRLRKHI